MSSSAFSSLTDKDRVTRRERVFGYLLGPVGGMLINMAVGSYLIVYYTDVLDLTPAWGGLFLTVFPLASKLVSIVTTVWVGRVIDRTSTPHGKARPWLLLATPLMIVSAILAVAVPNAPTVVQLIWVVFTYCLFTDIAFAVWGTAHNLMVPLASRRPEERGPLAVLTNMSTVMFAATVVSLVFPLVVLPAIGADKTAWLTMMVILTAVALPLMLMQYYFTRERVSEQTTASEPEKLKDQYKILFSSRDFVIYVAVSTLYVATMGVRAVSIVYYSNYVLGSYNDGITPTLIQAVGGLPIGLGLLFVWPLAKRFGKRNLTAVGLLLAFVGSLVTLAAPSSLPVVLTGQVIMNLGTVPAAFVFNALLGDILDHIEWKTNRRVDGAAVGVWNVALAVLTALGTATFTFLLGASGEYRAPSFDASTGVTTGFEQTSAVQGAIVFSFAGLGAVMFALLAVALFFVKVERDLPRIQADLARRSGDKQEEPLSPEDEPLRVVPENTSVDSPERTIDAR
ncbi:MFS transporter [Streptomyces collinus]|uniref:MFS transporter n=1 Tax=Streptomyces collinus TaxID=42684 RepID=UPI0036A29BA5